MAPDDTDSTDATDATDATPTDHDAPVGVDEADLDWAEAERGTRFAFRRKRLAREAGGRDVGCSLYEVPPGKRPWPTHYHEGNEEALYVLAGEGVLHTRDGADDVPLSSGTYVALPAGEAYARQIEATGDAPLRYLAVSTMRDPDVAVYPDSGKVGVFCGAAPGGDKSKRTLHEYFPLGDAVDYWAGEDTGEEAGPETGTGTDEH